MISLWVKVVSSALPHLLVSLAHSLQLPLWLHMYRTEERYLNSVLMLLRVSGPNLSEHTGGLVHSESF